MTLIRNKFFIFASIGLILSRIIVNILEINLFGISYGFHLLDKNLLQYDLLKSLFYLHSQPIGWNLFAGILTKLFNGNITYINNFFEFYQLFLTFSLLYTCILICDEISDKIIVKYLISIFIILNPSILFWEKIFSYQHTICTLIAMVSYLILKLYKTHDNKYEFYIYCILLLLSLIWSAFQPVLILIIFFLFRFFKIKIKKKFFIYFLFIIFLSFIPFVKNKIVFNTFTVGSWAGHQLSTTFLDWKDVCDLPNPKDIYSDENINDLRMYEKNYNRKFDHSSLVGESSKYNYIGIIYRSQNCLKITINRIMKNPKEYLTGRVYAFLASHGKFAFDFLHPKPEGWNKYYNKIDYFYSNKKIKLTRQVIIFTYMMIVYFFFLKLIFFSKQKNAIKKAYFTIMIIYFYILSVGHLATGHEHARMLYSGIIIHLLFYMHVLRNLFNEKKN